MRRLVAAVAAGAAMAVVAALATAPAQAVVTAPMVLTLTTTSVGTSAALPLDGTVAGITVDWGDGTVTGPYDAPTSAQHTYASTGVHYVTIAGTTLTHFGSAGAPGLAYTSELVTGVASFGTLGITDLSSAFEGAVNLRSVPATLPPGVTSLARTFRGARFFNGPITGWDTSSVTTMGGMFEGAEVFDQPIGGWDTSSVTDMSSMFAAMPGAGPQVWLPVFNHPIGAWDTSAVTTFSGMFRGNQRFNQPVSTWDISQATDLTHMFADAVAFNQPLVGWDMSSPGDMTGIFNGATALSVRNLSDLLAVDVVNSMMPKPSFRGFGASDSYLYQDNLAAVDAREQAMPVEIWDFQLVPAVAPSQVQPLVVSGDARVGATVRVTTFEVYTGLPMPTVTHRWQWSADGLTGWADVPGASATTLVVPAWLGGRHLRIVDTADNTVEPALVLPSANVLGPVAAIAPSRPRLVRVAPRNRSLRVSWGVPASTGGAALLRYRAVAVPVHGGSERVCVAPVPARTCAIKGLTNGTRYSVRVQAVNAATLRSAWSAALVATPRTVPGAVRSLGATPSASGWALARWLAPTASGGSPVTGYRVRWRFAGSTAWTGWASVSGRSATWPGWPWGSVSHVQVRAVSAAGAGPVAQASVVG